MRDILIVKDSDNEVGFDVVCKYCAVLQDRLGLDTIVIPIWPQGDIKLITKEAERKILVKELKEVLQQ